MANPPALPAQLSRPDAQMVVDALNKRSHEAQTTADEAKEGSPPTGAAGGGLTGTYPNPTLSTSSKELFPQLVTAAARKINFGLVEHEWPGGVANHTTPEIKHELGVEPKAVVFGNLVSGGLSEVITEVAEGSMSTTKFTARQTFITGFKPEAGKKTKFFWVAIG